MNVEMNPEEVRKTGSEHFPAMAMLFRSVEHMLSKAQSEHGGNGFWGSDLAASWNNHNEYTTLVAKTSAEHLDACGDTLEKVAKSHTSTDGENAQSINNTYYSDRETAWSKRYE